MVEYNLLFTPSMFYATVHEKNIDDLRYRYSSGSRFIPDGTRRIKVYAGSRFVGTMNCAQTHYPNIWITTKGDHYMIAPYTGKFMKEKMNGRYRT